MVAHDLLVTHLRGLDLEGARGPLPQPGMAGVAPIHVWVLGDEWLDAAVRAFETTLSTEEQRRRDAFAQRVDALRFTARRGLLRHLLSRYQGCDARDLRFVLRTHGKPALSMPVASAMQFNVSQTEGAMVLAFCGAGSIGVDVQSHNDGLALEEIAAEVFSVTEREALQAAAPQDRACRFFTTWARKEALLKALGVGFAAEPRRYTTEAIGTSSRWYARCEGEVLKGWTLLDLELATTLHAAVALRHTDD